MLGLRSFALGAAAMVIAGIGGAQSRHAMETFPMPSAVKDSSYGLKAEELILGVNLLMAAGYSFDDLPPDVLSVYYADFFIVEVVERGVANFREEFLPLSRETERDIASARTRVGATGMKDIFQRYVLARSVMDPAKVDGLIATALKTENVAELTSNLLDRTSQIEWLDDVEVSARLDRLALDRKLSAGN